MTDQHPDTEKQGNARTFPKSVRLRSQGDFDAVYRGKHYAADGVLVLRAIRNDLQHSRLGLSVSKKVGNAVVRNRWKRMIREAFRQQQHLIPGGMDVVVRPKKGATCNHADVFAALLKLCQRLDQKLQPAAKAHGKGSGVFFGRSAEF